MNDTYQMMMKLAERGLGKSFGGEGSEESRSVALILTAIDQLAMAGQLDSSMFPSIQRAIDELRQGVEAGSQGDRKGKEEKSPKEKKPQEEKEEEEEENKDGRPSLD